MIPEPYLDVINLYPYPVLLISIAGEIEAASDSIKAITGFDAAVLAGKPCSEIITASRDSWSSFLNSCFRNGKKVTETFTFRKKNGESVC